MPLYEYQCDACGTRFEQIQKFSDPRVEVCPTCGEKKVRKLVSSPAIQFKGSGFYINDYARKGAGATDAQGSSSKDTKDTKDSKESKDSSKDKDSKSADSSNANAGSGSTATPAPATPAKSGD
jgi:putative FmdB family regulatory protein